MLQHVLNGSMLAIISNNFLCVTIKTLSPLADFNLQGRFLLKKYVFFLNSQNAGLEDGQKVITALFLNNVPEMHGHRLQKTV